MAAIEKRFRILALRPTTVRSPLSFASINRRPLRRSPHYWQKP
jgi:hypothetical protein